MVTTIPELNIEQRQVVGALLVDILRGEISHETRKAVAGIVVADVPEPYHHLLSYTQGWVLDNIQLAHELRGELRYICEELENKYDNKKQ
jgi:hypothetical protein